LGGAMTSLIFPKCTRSVTRDGIFTSDYVRRHSPGLFSSNDEKARLLASRKRADSNLLLRRWIRLKIALSMVHVEQRILKSPAQHYTTFI
jgi:hypothetical protein